MSRTTRIVGILNLTPDSFSDGGDYLAPEVALRRIRELAAQGADVIDIGAESTRPGATPLSWEEEWARLSVLFSSPRRGEVRRGASTHNLRVSAPSLTLPLRGRENIAISIDTRHAETAKKALAAGADWINDVGGFSDAAMVEAVRANDCMLVVMHSLTVPADPSVTLPKDADPLQFLVAWGKEKLAALEGQGIARERIILDPGIGFGKTAEQSLEILRRIEELHAWEAPILVGHSRKSFLRLLGEDRNAATAEVSAMLRGKVDYLRVHEVVIPSSSS